MASAGPPTRVLSPDGFSWLDGERLILYGAGTLADAPRLLEHRGLEGYAVLTTERGRAAAPELLEAATAVALVPPGPVPEAAAAVRSEVGKRPLVALGGGRVIDAAKAIAGADGLTCAAVPTTLSGAEMSRWHRMPAGVHTFMLTRPAVVIADPDLMASQPMPDLAASAMNAMGHAVESLYTTPNPVAESVGLRAAALIARALGGGDPDRGDLALGALLAGWAIAATGYAVHHVVCQTIVRVAGTPHAQTNAIIVPHTVRLVTPRAPVAIGRLGRALGRPDDDPAPVADGVARVAATAGVTRLSELGVEHAQLGEVADAASGRPELGNTPDPPDRAELLQMLEAAL